MRLAVGLGVQVDECVFVEDGSLLFLNLPFLLGLGWLDPELAVESLLVIIHLLAADCKMVCGENVLGDLALLGRPYLERVNLQVYLFHQDDLLLLRGQVIHLQGLVLEQHLGHQPLNDLLGVLLHGRVAIGCVLGEVGMDTLFEGCEGKHAAQGVPQEVVVETVPALVTDQVYELDEVVLLQYVEDPVQGEVLHQPELELSGAQPGPNEGPSIEDVPHHRCDSQGVEADHHGQGRLGCPVDAL